jgi:hypothetical protein
VKRVAKTCEFHNLSRDTQRLFTRLYLEGLSSGDFEPPFRQLLGSKATLSASTMLRLRAVESPDLV